MSRGLQRTQHMLGIGGKWYGDRMEITSVWLGGYMRKKTRRWWNNVRSWRSGVPFSEFELYLLGKIIRITCRLADGLAQSCLWNWKSKMLTRAAVILRFDWDFRVCFQNGSLTWLLAGLSSCPLGLSSVIWVPSWHGSWLLSARILCLYSKERESKEEATILFMTWFQKSHKYTYTI